MNRKSPSIDIVRPLIKLSGIFTALILIFLVAATSCSSASGSSASEMPDSNFNGVQIGVISYSWRSMQETADSVLSYCKQAGISSIELMGYVAEKYAGIPEAKEEKRDWRLSVSMDKYVELRTKFNAAGVKIHIVKFAPAKWSDEEIDYAFRAARAMGAGGITNEIGHEACARLGKFAEKHDMYAIFHNHGQPGNPDFNFEEFLAYSPNNMLNLDVGHYFGATGKHPNGLIEKLHERIYSIHLKDKTGKDADPSDTNMPWGEGNTPLGDILGLIQENGWPIYCDIELEYAVPGDSDAVMETAKCVAYCKDILIN